MSSLQIYSSSSSSSNPLSYSNQKSIIVYQKNPQVIVPKHRQKKLYIDQLNILSTIPNKIPIIKDQSNDHGSVQKLYMITEFVCDRIEMHKNIGDQRKNWNSLLLNSINMITLSASTMAGLCGTDQKHILAMKVSTIMLFTMATGMVMIMNKIQPSQLVEEHRNAVRLFKKLKNHIQTIISMKNASKIDVGYVLKKVLALDRAYPLPLLGSMIEKLPKKFNPSVWWPSKDRLLMQRSNVDEEKPMNNGWNKELEEEMNEIMRVIRDKDLKDYVRLGNNALKLHKYLAISGPLLTGVAAMGSCFLGHGAPWAGLVAAAAGSLAVIVNTVEHGGQVGMVFEMYRTCAGFFKYLEEMIEMNLVEGDLSKREDGELFEMRMGLYLGRSLYELRDLANKSSRNNGGSVDEFASKLF